MRSTILLFFFITLVNAVSAQKNGIVRGFVFDSISNHIVSGATVTMLKKKDSSLVSFTMTDNKGIINLADNQNGSMPGMNGSNGTGINSIAAGGINYNNLIGNGTDFTSNFFTTGTALCVKQPSGEHTSCPILPICIISSLLHRIPSIAIV